MARESGDTRRCGRLGALIVGVVALVLAAFPASAAAQEAACGFMPDDFFVVNEGFADAVSSCAGEIQYPGSIQITTASITEFGDEATAAARLAEVDYLEEAAPIDVGDEGIRGQKPLGGGDVVFRKGVYFVWVTDTSINADAVRYANVIADSLPGGGASGADGGIGSESWSDSGGGGVPVPAVIGGGVVVVGAAGVGLERARRRRARERADGEREARECWDEVGRLRDALQESADRYDAVSRRWGDASAAHAAALQPLLDITGSLSSMATELDALIDQATRNIAGIQVGSAAVDRAEDIAYVTFWLATAQAAYAGWALRAATTAEAAAAAEVASLTNMSSVASRIGALTGPMQAVAAIDVKVASAMTSAAAKHAAARAALAEASAVATKEAAGAALGEGVVGSADFAGRWSNHWSTDHWQRQLDGLMASRAQVTRLTQQAQTQQVLVDSLARELREAEAQLDAALNQYADIENRLGQQEAGCRQLDAQLARVDATAPPPPTTNPGVPTP